MKNVGISIYHKRKDVFKDMCVYRCSTCDICQEYIKNYYQNTALIRDDDENLHIPHVMA